MAVKIPLKMSDGTPVKTIEELREHFDFIAVLDYYNNGRLKKWLKDRYYDKEAEKIEALESSSEDFKKNLCDILGVPYLDNESEQLKLDEIKKKNKRREYLKKLTVDDEILASADNVAFTQKELKDLLGGTSLLGTDEDGNKIIYLCGDYFTIPANIGGIVYTGVNKPVVKFDSETIEAGIDLQNVEFDMSNYVEDSSHNLFFKDFKNNLSLGIKLLQQAAEHGNAEAQFLLGLCYITGEGLEDREIAAKWLEKAASQNHVDANVILYTYCIWFTGGELARKAIRWFEEADKQNSRYAYLGWDKLGQCYLHGIGVERDYEVAVKWLKKAVEQDFVNVLASTQYYLGYCYYYGYGVKQDHTEAVKWLQKAAEQGYEEAQSLLVLCTGDEEEKNKETLKKVKKYAEQGDAWSQNFMGMSYECGLDVEENFLEAVKWYRRAAEQNYADAQNHLDSCCESFSEIDEEIVAWYKKATKQNDADAQNYLGLCYEEGRGVEVDIDEAREWYAKAVGQGHTAAKENFSRCASSGLKNMMQKFSEALESFSEKFD